MEETRSVDSLPDFIDLESFFDITFTVSKAYIVTTLRNSSSLGMLTMLLYHRFPTPIRAPRQPSLCHQGSQVLSLLGGAPLNGQVLRNSSFPSGYEKAGSGSLLVVVYLSYPYPGRKL